MQLIDQLLDNWDPNHDKWAQHTNNHTLLVKSGLATDEQLEECLKNFLLKVSRILNREIKCQYQSNLIIGRNGRYYGFGYLWLSNPEIYNILLGRNPDGTERIEYTTDPNWKEPEKPLDEALAEVQYKSSSWADWADEDDEIAEKYKPPTKEVVLQPLLEMSEFFYTEKQKKLIVTLCKEKNITFSYLPKTGKFEFYPARVGNLDDNYCPNVIC